MLYGFAGSGKSTIAKKYLDEHSLSIAIEGDAIISMIGQWRKFEKESRALVFEDTLSITRNHLTKGCTVLLPYLLTDNTHAEIFESLALEHGCIFREVYLKNGNDVAIERLLERGVWGEEGSPALTKSDMSEIEELFEIMEKEMSKRPNCMIVEIQKDDIDATYRKFLELVSKQL